MQGQKTQEQCSYQNVQCVIVQNQNLKQQEASGLLGSSLASLSKIPLVGPLLFKEYKMNDIIYYKILLAGDKFMPERHLRQLGFT